MSKVKIFGLIGEFLSKTKGMAFSAELSMIVEQLLKDNSEMIEGMKRIEAIAQGQVLGLAKSGKIALDDSTSQYLTVDEKFAEIRLAKEKFRDCYGALSEIPQLNQYRGEVAFQIACCNAMLGINDRRDYWLRQAYNDFLEFGNATIEGASEGKKKFYQVRAALGAAPAIPAFATVLIVSGVGAPIGAATLALFYFTVAGSVASGIDAAERLQEIEAKQNQHRLDQASAIAASVEVKEVIALLANPADTSSAE